MIVKRCVFGLALLVAAAGVPLTSADEVAADVVVDVAMSREVRVGKTRIVLLQVARVVDFAGMGVFLDRPPVPSFRVVVLTEHLGDQAIDPLLEGGLDVLVPGQDKSAMTYRGGGLRLKQSTTKAAGYEKQFGTLLPLQKATEKDKAVVVTRMARDVTVAGTVVDLRLRLGVTKGEVRTVLFKNVPLE